MRAAARPERSARRGRGAETGKRRGRVALGLGLVALTLAAYAPLRHNDFVRYDDHVYISGNPHLRAGPSVEGVAWAFAGGYEANWIPLSWLSLLLDYELYGLDPRGFHATNLALHVAAALIGFAALRRLTGATGPSAFAAAVFALHPLHVESVAWASERKDVLSGLCFMLGLLAYARYTRRPSPGRLLAVAAALALGLLAKPMLVTFPFVLLLLDAWPLDRLRAPGARRLDPARVRRALLEKALLLPLSLAASLAALAAQRAGGGLVPVEAVPLGARAANAVLSYVMYLWKALWPRGLAAHYPHPGEAVSAAGVALAALLLLALTTAAVALRRRAPYLLFGWLFYLGTLVPVIGLVQVGSAAMADRYTYLPLLGPALALGFAARDLARRLPRRRALLGLAGGLALAALATATNRQVRVWRDTESLFTHALRVTGPNAVAHLGLGIHLVNEGRAAEAGPHFAAAARLRPQSAQAAAGLGDVALAQGRLDDARRYYGRSVRLAPEHWGGHAGLAQVFAERGEPLRAVAHFHDALRVRPGSAELHAGLGRALLAAGRPADALAPLERALALEPRLAFAHGVRAQALARLGRHREAIAGYRRALALEPARAELRGPLGVALLRAGRHEEASSELEAALRARPEVPELHRAAAEAASRLGRDARAVAHYREVLRLRPESPDAANNLAWLLATSADAAVRDGAAAVGWAERALALGGADDPLRLDTLAAAYAAAGEPERAAATAERALALAADRPALAAGLRDRLAAYRARAAAERTRASPPGP